MSHLPSAILSLPAFVSRSPPDNSCMYPSWISRSLCSAGIVRCIKPLAQSRNETNSSWVNGADKSEFIFQICASGIAVQASHPATIKLTHYPAPSVIFSDLTRERPPQLAALIKINVQSPTQPGGFFFRFCRARRMLTGDPFNPTFFGAAGITSEPKRAAHRCSKRL